MYRDLGKRLAGSTAVARCLGSAADVLLLDLEVRVGPEEEAKMRYAYRDLGKQLAGSTAVVRWRGSAADVVLLDSVGFSKYRAGRSAVFYSGGGRYHRSPAGLSIPEDGHWYVVADFHGSAAAATVEVLEPHAREQQATHEEPLVPAG